MVYGKGPPSESVHKYTFKTKEGNVLLNEALDIFYLRCRTYYGKEAYRQQI